MNQQATTPLPDIVESIDVEAPIEKVWRALSNPDSVSQWFGCLQFEAKIGHVFYMQPDEAKRDTGDIDGATHCEVLALEPNDRLEFSWYMPGMPKTIVTLKLAAANDQQTTVHLTHVGWDQFPRAEVEEFWRKLKGGWQSFVLPNLKSFAETL